MPSLKYKPFNWKELEVYVSLVREIVAGTSIEQMIVPIRRECDLGFLLNEWVWRLSNGNHLLFGLQPSRPYFALGKGKGFKSSTRATFSPEQQELSKLVRGRKIQGIEAISGDRILKISFSKYSLFLFLIPAQPNFALVSNQNEVLVGVDAGSPFRLPTGDASSEHGKIRDIDLFNDPFENSKRLNNWIQKTALEARSTKIRRLLTTKVSKIKKQIEKSENSIAASKAAKDIRNLADILKASLHDLPDIESDKDGSYRMLRDYRSGKKVRVPSTPGLSPAKELEKLYTKARKGKTKEEEARARRQESAALLKIAESQLSQLEDSENLLQAIENLEGELGLLKKKETSSKKELPGREFTSKDGWTIRVGRNQRDNLDLTFKFAKGNDVWLHVRGRPSAHAVIQQKRGKQPPLETLLDAAQLVLHHSKLKSSGQVEVDYTAKKYVKRIKNSTQVHYSQNKTLVVNTDALRLKRLKSS